MRGWFLGTMLLLIAGVLLFGGWRYEPGYVLISYGTLTVEMTLWVALAAALALATVLVLLFWLWRQLGREGSRVLGWFSGRRQRRSQQLTTQGVIAFIEGHWEQSRRTLLRAVPGSDTPLLNYLFAARASSQLGEDKQVKHYLQLAEQSTSGAAIAVDLTQAELHLEHGRLEDCLATLMRVRQQASKHPYVLKLLVSVYIGLNDWRNLAQLLPELRQHRIVSEAELDRLELQASRATLEDIRHDTAALTQSWRSLHKKLRRNPELVADYARLLLAQGEQDQAEEIIRQQLNYAWSTELIGLYGRLRCQLPDQQLIVAENWLKERNNDPELLLALGRICLQNQLWGRARNYFESCLKLSRNAPACAELARLLAYLGEHEKSNRYFQQGLLMITDQLPDVPAYRNKTTVAGE